MNHVFAKLRQRIRNKYRIILSTEERIYPELDFALLRQSSYPYSPSTLLESDEWFFIGNATHQGYAQELLRRGNADTVEFDALDEQDFENIDFLWVRENAYLCFQRVSRAKLISKRSIHFLGGRCRFEGNRREIPINKFPDAVYAPSDNRLYFRRLDAITSIFNGIDQVYRTATDEEVAQFLQSRFISLQNGYDVSHVGIANRKRLALAQRRLDEASDEDKGRLFQYVGEYCPQLRADNGAFQIGSDDNLKMLLFGIDQRFYTTPVGDERRLANSVVLLQTDGRIMGGQ
jgi:hypothetical protein